MNHRVLLSFLLSAAAFFGGTLCAKEVKLLTVGNSFSNSITLTLPKIVASEPECKLKLVIANIGGCSLEMHWNYHLKSEKDRSFKPYYDTLDFKPTKTSTLRELLTQEKWDVITIQQVSHQSWQKASFQPYADNLIRLIRELAPTAEIVIQQTWSYHAQSPYFSSKEFQLNQTQMYEKLTENYLELAKQHGFRIIPTGLAVQLYRKAMGDKLLKVDVAAMKQMQEPQLPESNDVVGRFYWNTDKKSGKRRLRADWIHMNPDGKYLQSLVWYGFLFGKDPQQAKYVPDGMSAEKAALLKRCAADALARFPQVTQKKSR